VRNWFSSASELVESEPELVPPKSESADICYLGCTWAMIDTRGDCSSSTGFEKRLLQMNGIKIT
jgi:hypothetical protein